MMNASDNAALTQAIALANAGDKHAARAILARLRSQYPTNADVLLWLIFTSDSPAEARSLLDTLTWTDPGNRELPRARQWVAERERTTSTPPSPYGQTTQYSTSSQSSQSPLFLLDPKNAAFVEGRTRKPRTLGTTIAAFFMIILFGAFFVAGVGTIGGYVNESHTRDQLTTSGVMVQARIVNKTSDDSDDSTTYNVTYSFTIGNQNRNYQRTESVNEDTYNSLSKGALVSVRYLPNDPTTSRFASIRTNDGYMLPLGGLFALIGAIGLGVVFVTARKMERINRKGSLVYGEVLNSSSKEDSDNDLILTVHYSFTTAMGQMIEGKSSATRNDLKKSSLPRAGTSVAVLYADPKNHRLL